MVKESFKRGDIVLVNCDPALGREQKGIRPALVVSHDSYNDNVSDIIVLCPITGTRREDPFLVPVSSVSSRTKGYILIDQIKAFDKKYREVKKLDRVTEDCMEIVKAKLVALLTSN